MCSAAGEPSFGSDGSLCALNQACTDGNCTCSGCPNGVVAPLSPTLCMLPSTVVASANKTFVGGTANQAHDGTGTTAWNSGTYDGTLTLEFTTPQPMVAFVIYLSGEGVGTKIVNVDATITRGAAPDLVKSGTFDYSDAKLGPVRFELGLTNVQKLTLSFASPSTWIAVNEVLFEVCN